MNTKQRELIRDLEGYLELKLQGYREVDRLPENHAMVQTPVRLLEQVRKLFPDCQGRRVFAADCVPATLAQIEGWEVQQ